MKKKDFTISQASRKLGISKVAILKALRTGKLKGKKVPPPKSTYIWMIDAKSVEEYRVSSSHQERGKNT